MPHPLINAIMKDDIEAVNILLETGQDPNMQDEWSVYCTMPPLTYSIQLGYLDIAKVLLDKGADVMVGAMTSFNCSSAMTVAIVKNNIEAVELLLQYGHPINKDVFMFSMKCKRNYYIRT